MPLLDDLKTPMSEEDRDRRKFLALVGTGALATAMAGTTVTTVLFLEPEVLFEEDRRFAVGAPEDITEGTVVVLRKQNVYVVRTDVGFYALSSVCTHLGCMTRYERNVPGFFCPCHGSRFSLGGAVTGGPAPRPLERLHVEVDRGRLVVDAARVVAPDFILAVT